MKDLAAKFLSFFSLPARYFYHIYSANHEAANENCNKAFLTGDPVSMVKAYLDKHITIRELISWIANNLENLLGNLDDRKVQFAGAVLLLTIEFDDGLRDENSVRKSLKQIHKLHQQYEQKGSV